MSVIAYDTTSFQAGQQALFAFLGISTLFVIAEGLILVQFSTPGLIVHSSGLLVLFAFIHISDDILVNLYQSMLLVPLMRIFNLGTPLVADNILLNIGVLYTSLLLSVLLIVRSQNLTYETLGLSLRGLRFGTLGLGVGLLLGVLQYSLSLEELMFEGTFWNYLLLILTAGILLGFVEETIFRGLIQRWAAATFNTPLAIVTTSVLFAAMHGVWLTPVNIVFAGVVSLFFGWIYARTNNLWFVAGAHGMINVTLFLLAPIVVAG